MIFREAILHVWIFVEVHYLLRNLRGRKKRKSGKFNFTILQNKFLDKFLLIKTLSKFPFSFKYQFINSCIILKKWKFFWQSASDVEVFCYKTNSYCKIIPPPVLWKITSGLGMELELEKRREGNSKAWFWRQIWWVFPYEVHKTGRRQTVPLVLKFPVKSLFKIWHPSLFFFLPHILPETGPATVKTTHLSKA